MGNFHTPPLLSFLKYETLPALRQTACNTDSAIPPKFIKRGILPFLQNCVTIKTDFAQTTGEKETLMKLSYKRTVLVGFAFFLICLFWQAYDNTIPLILTNKFGMSQTLSGAIMALDNVLALFLLPFFGALSDKCASRFGKRTPFIAVGTLAAAVLFVCLSFVDSAQMTRLEDVTLDRYESSLAVIYESNPTISLPEETADGMSVGEAIRHVFASGQKKPLQEIYPNRSEFLAIKMYREDGTLTEEYENYVKPARNAYAWQQTADNPNTLIFFILLLLCTLVAMGTFRSPAVALMPDVTPKPLRSKANAIINLMGTFGGITVLVLGMIFKTGSAKNIYMSYTPFFIVVSLLMLLSLAIFLMTVREPKWSAETEALSAPAETQELSDSLQSGRLSAGERRSLLFILASVALWYMGYNAVTSKYSVYALNVLEKDYNTTLLIAQAAAIVSYLPIGFLSTKIGRKKAILGGVAILTVSFGAAAFMRHDSPTVLMNLLFALAGIGWATINVNSYPMVVELAKGGNVGKYTGYYYTASMAAQTITPILSGFFMDIHMTSLFIYAAFFVLLAFFTMLCVRHGDTKPIHPGIPEAE